MLRLGGKEQSYELRGPPHTAGKKGYRRTLTNFQRAQLIKRVTTCDIVIEIHLPTSTLFTFSFLPSFFFFFFLFQITDRLLGGYRSTVRLQKSEIERESNALRMVLSSLV